MSLRGIMALFRSSLIWMWPAILAGFLFAIALAQSAQAQSTAVMQAVASAEPHSQIDAAAIGASTILKTPAITVQPIPLSGVIQSVPSATAQLIPASAVAPLLAKAATDMNNVATPSTGAGMAAAKIGAVAPVSASNPGANAASAVQLQVDGLELLSPVQRRTYQRAASAFTSFCHDWERMLHEREVNNLEHLSWREDGGLETATYTGYGKVESCECKASKEGLPIGKIRYEEINYSIMGKTIEEARHAAPKLIHEISTLEIFSWEKGKWFY